MTVKLQYDHFSELAPITLPGSKSIAARALILRSVFGNHTDVIGLPDCDDTRELSEAIARLSDEYTRGIFDSARPYNLGTGGTSLRFFTALAASLPGFEGLIDCSDALRARPLSPLINALRQAGAVINYLDREGCAPIYIFGRKLNGNGVSVNSAVSSQFASALILASPLWSESFKPERNSSVSRPYIDMTQRMVGQFAALPCSYQIESDWSAAAFFYEYALLRPDTDILIFNLPPLEGSLQGDSACASIFARIGVSTIRHADGEGILRADGETIRQLRLSGRPLLFDLSDLPDLVPALAVGLSLAGIHFMISGIGHLRHKESDRLSALCTELRKAGYHLTTDGTSLSWLGKRVESHENHRFSSHGDHRIAMALAITGERWGEVEISDAEAVTKSFPGFYHQLPAHIRLPQ